VAIVQLPQTISQQSANLFDLESSMIEAYLQMLIADPTNQKAKTGLAQALTALSSNIQAQAKTADTILSQLSSFSTNIGQDAPKLAVIAQGALDDAGTDTKTITKLQGEIESLKQQIQTAQTIITISEIGIGVSLFVGLVGVLCCLIPGAEGVGAGLIVLGVAGEVTSITLTAVESVKVKDFQNEIDSDQKQITGLHQDIILLNGISAQFNALYQSNQQAQKALASILAMWTNLDGIVNQVKDEIASTNTDVTSEQYQQALTDFQQAEASWADVVKFATALAGINYSWQDADGNWHNYGAQTPTLNGSTITQVPSSIAA
jgi:predicted  nucleic acid-binding Zn-ribbon protein